MEERENYSRAKIILLFLQSIASFLAQELQNHCLFIFKPLDKGPQNLIRSQSMKIINPTKTHLEISATSENNSKIIVGEELPCRWRALGSVVSWICRGRTNFILMNPKWIKYSSEYVFLWGCFPGWWWCLSHVCLPKRSQ